MSSSCLRPQPQSVWPLRALADVPVAADWPSSKADRGEPKREKKTPEAGVSTSEREGGEEGTTRRRSTQLIYCHVMVCGMASIDADEARPVVVRETEEGRARDP